MFLTGDLMRGRVLDLRQTKILVYLERKSGMEFGLVQQEIETHFLGLILAATVFTAGIILYIIDFIKYGRPSDEALVALDSNQE